MYCQMKSPPPSSFNRGEQVRLSIFRMKVREMGKLPLVSLFVRISRHIVLDQCTFGLDRILSANQVPMGVALGCEGLGRPDKVSFGRAGIERGVTFCPEKFAYRVRLGELGPRRLSRTRRRSYFVHNSQGQPGEHLFYFPQKKKRASALFLLIVFRWSCPIIFKWFFKKFCGF